MRLKKPLTIREQMDKLEQHNLTLDYNDQAIYNILLQVSYYRLSGFAVQFRDPNNSEQYLNKTKFSTIYKIYLFDQELHNVLYKYLLQFELYARTQIALGLSISLCQKSPYDQHYDIIQSTYKYCDKARKVFNSLDREKQYEKDSLFVNHHNLKYEGEMPLWVMVELLSFTNLSKFYASLANYYQDVITSNTEFTADSFRNYLHCFATIRNKIAHGGRLYNIELNPPIQLGKTFLRAHSTVCSSSLFAYIVGLLRSLPEAKSKDDFLEDLQDILEEYHSFIDFDLIGFPEDWESILMNEILNPLSKRNRKRLLKNSFDS